MQTLKKTPKPLIELKQSETDHFNALQKKNTNDTDLIDDIRTFCKSKATADREYAQTMQKLVQNLTMKRRNLMEKEETEEFNVWTIWKRLLLQYEEAIMMRMATADMLQRLSDQIKPIRNNRVSTNKRILEQLKCLQVDLFSCVQEMVKAQKIYSEDEKETYEVKMKAEDAAAKVRNKSTNIFNSMANLHKHSDKLSSRLDAYQTRSTVARNEYLFQLAAINAHLNNYFETDLGDYGEIIDTDIYERFKELFVTITTDEYNFSQKHTEIWYSLIDLSTKINRQYHWNKFLEKNISFKNRLEYKFQPIKNDKVRLLISPNPKEDTLGNVTRKLVKRLIVREHKISGYEKEIKSFESGKVTPPPTGTSTILSPNPPDSDMGVEDLVSYNQEYVEHKVEELKFAIRKEQIEKVKIEACLGLLKKSGVDTDHILQEARDAVAAATEMMLRSGTSGIHPHNQYNDQDRGSPRDDPRYYPQDVSERYYRPADHYMDDPEVIGITGSDPDCDQEVYSMSRYTGSYRVNNISGNYDSDTSTTPSQSQHQLNLPSNTSQTVSPSNHDSGSQHTQEESVKNKAQEESPDSYDDIWSKEHQQANNDENNDKLNENVDLNNNENDKEGLGKAIAIYEFQADPSHWEESDLVVDEEVILVSEQDHDGWIKVKSLIDSKEGIVPISYLKIIEKYEAKPKEIKRKVEKINSENNSIKIQSKKNSLIDSKTDKKLPENEDLVKAAYAFAGTSIDELKLEKDDVIKVITRLSNEGIDDGWWEGYKMKWDSKCNNWISTDRGFFPSMVVVKLKETASSIMNTSNSNTIVNESSSPPPPVPSKRNNSIKKEQEQPPKLEPKLKDRDNETNSSQSLSDSGNSSNFSSRKRPSVKLDLTKIKKNNQSEDRNIPETTGTTERIGDYITQATENCEDNSAKSNDSNKYEIKEI